MFIGYGYGYPRSLILGGSGNSSFVITVNTALAGSASNTIQLPIQGTGMVINWGDGSSSTHTQTATPAPANWITKTYAASGTYQISISPQITRIFFNDTGDKAKLTFIDNWGTAVWSSMAAAFHGCSAMQGRWNDVPVLTSVTSMASAFQNCALFNYAMNNWNTSAVTNMFGMFAGASVFNQNIGSWNTAAATNMSFMFNDSAFNQNIGSWNTAAVTNMQGMFQSNSVFNQNISGWNVSAVSNMQNLFLFALAFNQNIGSWNLRLAGVNMAGMLNNNGMNTANYSQTLIGWANYASGNSNTPASVTLGATGRTYNNTSYVGTTYTDAVSARAYLVGVSPNPAWTISGDSQV